MSYKLVDRIQKIRWLPGKHKRVLAAWASYANKDGRNIFCSKESAGDRATVSRWTVYRNTDELLESGLIRVAGSHTCKVEGCGGGPTHFTGKMGHWTTAYEIDISDQAVLQNAEAYFVAKCVNPAVAKRRIPHVAKCDAIRGIRESALADRSGLGDTDPSVVEHHGEVSQSVSGAGASTLFDKEEPDFESGNTKTKPTPTPEDDLVGKRFDDDEEDKHRPPKPDFGDGIESLWSEVLQCWVTSYDAYDELTECFPAFKNTMPSATESRLMQEIIVRLNTHHVLARTLMEFARKHKQNAPGLIPRSVAGLHKAIFEGSSTNGLLAQTEEHNPKLCGICRKELEGMPCDRCHGSTYGKPTMEEGKPFCQDCMRLPYYRRHSRVKMEASL